MMSVYRRSYRRCLSQHCSGVKIVEPCDGGAVPHSEALMETGVPSNRSMVWLPRHSVTRRTAKTTREVQCSWNARLGPSASVVPAEKVLQLFNDLQIYPTNAQVNEMLQCAQKCAGRNSARYLTFTEFCIFATELKKSIHGRIHRREYFTRLLQKDGFNKASKPTSRKMSDSPFAEVFLGGSCNPTTWRRDEAIPILEKYGVTFYNPQVSEWRPELIELEHQAKLHSRILLYVIDNQTRNVVNFIEVANFLGNRRRVILVINWYKGPGHIVASEKITPEEFNDLSANLCLLMQLIERRKVPTFSKVDEAVMHVTDLVKGSHKKKEEIKNEQKLMRMKEAFESLDADKCGLINSTDICKALRLLSQKRSQSAELATDIKQKIGEHNRTGDESMKLNFEQFARIVSELNLNGDKKYKNGNIDNNSTCTKFFRSLSTPDEKRPFTASEDDLRITDIYLGGDCHPDLNWRQKIAIPMIKNACLTFYNPENERRFNQKISSSEFAVISNSNILLFVISNTSRGLFTMTLAAYYLGVNANMVLCIQQLPERCVLGSDELSELALKDYNRGRMYLADMARRQNVPIFESIQDAVKAAVDKTIG